MKMPKEKPWILSGVQPSHRFVYTGTPTNNRFSWPTIFNSIQIFKFFIFIFWPHHAAHGILVPQPGMEPTPPAVEAWSVNYWTAREVPNSIQLSVY